VGVDAVGAGVGAGGTIFFGDGKGTRYGLGIGLVGCLPGCKVLLKKAWNRDRTGFGAISAARAFCCVNVSWRSVQGDSKVSSFPGDGFCFTKGV